VRAVLFDYGRTLVDFDYPRQGLLATLEQARTWLGPDSPNAEELLQKITVPIEASLEASAEQLDEIDYLDLHEKVWREAGFALPRSTLLQIVDIEQQCWAAAARLDAHALEILDALRELGLRTGICSNAPFPPRMMRRQMHGLGIAQRVDVIVLSADVGRRKPDPAIYMTALEQLGTGPPDTLFVGDRLKEDYEGPRQLGMKAVLYQPGPNLAQPPGVDVIASLSDLMRVVR
jgi:putative hydrolase of the HAD superfamily